MIATSSLPEFLDLILVGKTISVAKHMLATFSGPIHLIGNEQMVVFLLAFLYRKGTKSKIDSPDEQFGLLLTS